MLLEMAVYIIERSQTFTRALNQHLWLTFVSLAISVVLGLVLGIISSRIGWLRNTLLTMGNVGRTIPSLAILALALPLLGIGAPPTVLALVLIGTLPIFINATVGIEQVDDSIKEAARGMGMNDLQVLLRVELPIATSVIMAGIRTSAVLIVASATLAAFVGGGGLGDLILQGHALNRDHIMLAGAIPATLLAFYFEETFGRLENWATPRGLKIGERGQESGGLLGLVAAIATMPLVFGALLPWATMSAEGQTVVLTGLHPEFRAIGLPVLLLGLVATMWPRKGESGQEWPTSLFTSGAGILAFLWMMVGVARVLSTLPGNQQLGLGFYLQVGAAVLLLIITTIELVLSLRPRQRGPALSREAAASPAT
ncbi:MAG TPA: ABC transporter permease [Candidatus Sulfomarinibacteraceae bacterium]|nr:ABC transporter permease [Candidatus Sulfomarinibacteraceae bacterium]